MAEEKAAKLTAARLQVEQEVADAIAQQTAQRQSQADSAQQPASSESQHASAESPEVSPGAQAAESQSQLLRDIRAFVKIAREGIKQRQVALQYARSSWQVQTAYTHIVACVIVCVHMYMDMDMDMYMYIRFSQTDTACKGIDLQAVVAPA